MLSSLPCHQLFLNMSPRFHHFMIRSLAYHHRVLELSSSVPSSYDPVFRKISPLRHWHSTSSNLLQLTTTQRLMYCGQYTTETITKAYYEIGEGAVTKIWRSLIIKFLSVIACSFPCRHLFQHVMVRFLTCHPLLLSMSAPVPTCHDPFLIMAWSFPSHAGFCSIMSLTVV